MLIKSLNAYGIPVLGFPSDMSEARISLCTLKYSNAEYNEKGTRECIAYDAAAGKSPNVVKQDMGQ